MSRFAKVMTFLIVAILVISGTSFLIVSKGIENNQIVNEVRIYPIEKVQAEVVPEKDGVEALLENMTDEEKVGQLFIVSLRNLKGGSGVKVMNGDVKSLIIKYKVGGIILFGENIDTAPQTSQLIKDMKKISKTPLFISVDEEGGRVSRINTSGKLHGTKIPTNKIIGATQNPIWAEKIGHILGSEIASLGFNMDFAPVADINTNPKNPIIGDRAFGAGPIRVSNMVEAELKGLQAENVSAVLKHFPGHGDTSMDSHTGAVSVSHDKKRLDDVELKPFKRGIDAGVDGVMVGHIIVRKVEPLKKPASLSKKMVTDILRDELNFKGLIITDALDMGAITKYYTAKNAAIEAFNGGVDILLMPASLDKAYNGILQAVKTGDISKERLDASVRRILEIKKKRGILSRTESNLVPEKTLGSQEHKLIIRDMMKKGN